MTVTLAVDKVTLVHGTVWPGKGTFVVFVDNDRTP